MLGGVEWGELDHKLVFAYQLYVDTTCRECGGYLAECRNPDNKGLYEVQQDLYCYRKEALEDVTRAKDYKSGNGQILHVTEIDKELVSRPALTFQAAEGGSPRPG